MTRVAWAVMAGSPDRPPPRLSQIGRGAGAPRAAPTSLRRRAGSAAPHSTACPRVALAWRPWAARPSAPSGLRRPPVCVPAVGGVLERYRLFNVWLHPLRQPDSSVGQWPLRRGGSPSSSNRCDLHGRTPTSDGGALDPDEHGQPRRPAVHARAVLLPTGSVRALGGALALGRERREGLGRVPRCEGQNADSAHVL